MSISLGRERALATAVTGASQALTLLGAALLGVLIAARFGSDAQTDGFFVANAIYGIALFVGQSLRTTSSAALVQDAHGNGPDLLAAVGWLSALAAALFAVLGVAVVPIATGDLPSSAQVSAQQSLAILLPAAVLQLAGGLVAALLATRAQYTAAALSYAIGSLGGVGAFLLLTPAAGITGVPLALLAGAVLTVLVLAGAAARGGGFPRGRPRLRASLHRTRQLLLGSTAIVAAQVMVTSSVAFAAADGEGAATTYSYAVMAVSALMAGAVTPVSVVFAPVVAASWDRTAASLADAAVRSFRAGALLIVPLVAGLLLLAPAPAAQLLTAFPKDDLEEVFLLALVLSPALLATLAMMIPQLGLLTIGRFGALAATSAAIAMVHVALSAGVSFAGGGLPSLAAVATLSSVLLAGGTLALALGRETRRAGVGILVAMLQLVTPGVVAFGAATAVLAPDGEFLRGAAAWMVGLIGMAGWLGLRRRDEIRSLAAAATRRGT